VLMKNYLMDEKSPFMASLKPDEVRVFNARWKHVLFKFGKLCNVFCENKVHGASTSHAVEVMTWLTKFIMTMPIADRQVRANFLANFEYFTGLLPKNPPYSMDVEQQLMKPIKEYKKGLKSFVYY